MAHMRWYLSWLERSPVTGEVVGSSPIHRANRHKTTYEWFFVLNTHTTTPPDFMLIYNHDQLQQTSKDGYNHSYSFGII